MDLLSHKERFLKSGYDFQPIFSTSSDKNQLAVDPKNNAPCATVSTSPQREPVVEDSCYDESMPGGTTEALTLPEETNSEQNAVIKGGLAKKPMGLTERERRRSADILAELRAQGIIKMASGTSQNRQGDDTILIATERPSQKPAAKLEKLEIKREKENNLKIKDTESKTRVQQLKQELLTDRPSPIIDHESRTTGKEIDNSTFEVQKASSTFQLLSLNQDTRNLMQKEEEECYSFEDFDVVESDVNYNTINETF